MDGNRLYQHQLLNLLQTVLLIGGMVVVLWLSAWLISDAVTAFWVAGGAVLALLLAPKLSPALILRMYKAEPITARSAPQLASLVRSYAQLSGMPRPPDLYYVPSQVMNAFAVGEQEDSAIGLTDGLLRKLSLRELSGVVAHEIAHISHHDVKVMGLADMVSRITRVLSLTGQIWLLLGLPVWLLGGYSLPLAGIALLILAPSISGLLQLALSRAREFNADLNAVQLTGDPQGLASALAKLERYQGGWLEQLVLPARRNPDPSILRTHPSTEDRIARLMALEAPTRLVNEPHLQQELQQLFRRHPPPRQWPWGVWY